MLERSKDFVFLRENLADAYKRQEEAKDDPPRLEPINLEIHNYLLRWHEYARYVPNQVPERN